MSSALPGNYDISIYRGDTFDQDLVFNFATAWDSGGNPTAWSPVDMTGGTLLAQVRDGTLYTANVLETFTINNFVPASGSFSIALAPTDTATVTWTEAFYDVQFTDSSGNVSTLIYGTVTMIDDVSH